MIDIEFADPFRQLAREHGFGGDVELMRVPLRSVLEREHRVVMVNERVWIEWVTGKIGIDNVRPRIWLGGVQTGNLLTLDQIRTTFPPEP